VYLGTYDIIANNNHLITLQPNETLQLSVVNDSIEIKNLKSSLGKYKFIEFNGSSSINVMRYKPVVPSMQQRYYDDDMHITAENGVLRFINKVELENYVCGVVESESGYQATKEFYKTQAILCRTFALENLGKHFNEGFHLCDDVHCQAYKGKNYSLSFHSIIWEAVEETKNLVIVDSTNTIITAAFHANCGGQTMNSEEVWGKAKPYLRSVKDNFCQFQRNTQWEKKIPVSDFNDFLQLNFPNVAKNFNLNQWNFNQWSRKSHIKINNDSIPLRRIREYFQLRSTFFSIIPYNDSLIFKGKGIGHGVGMCQDGAIQMAKTGYKAEDIIKFYYKGVRIASYLEIPFYQSILPNSN
jgi:stage II sporulation protein D